MATRIIPEGKEHISSPNQGFSYLSQILSSRPLDIPPCLPLWNSLGMMSRDLNSWLISDFESGVRREQGKKWLEAVFSSVEIPEHPDESGC